MKAKIMMEMGIFNTVPSPKYLKEATLTGWPSFMYRNTMINGRIAWLKPAMTTPILASHSERAPRQRWTMNWLAQLYQIPTENAAAMMPVQGMSWCVGA